MCDSIVLKLAQKIRGERGADIKKRKGSSSVFAIVLLPRTIVFID
jgi:hypothetical protein